VRRQPGEAGNSLIVECLPIFFYYSSCSKVGTIVQFHSPEYILGIAFVDEQCRRRLVCLVPLIYFTGQVVVSRRGVSLQPPFLK
jgi:hypothetical protein